MGMKIIKPASVMMVCESVNEAKILFDILSDWLIDYLTHKIKKISLQIIWNLHHIIILFCQSKTILSVTALRKQIKEQFPTP